MIISFPCQYSVKKLRNRAFQRQQILFKKQKPLFYFEQSFIFPITCQIMDQPNTDNNPQRHPSHTSLQPQIRETANSNRPQRFPWDLRWLRGEQYKNMLENKRQYCLQYGFSECRADQHPLQIYQQPKNGMIYFVKQKTIKSLRNEKDFDGKNLTSSLIYPNLHLLSLMQQLLASRLTYYIIRRRVIFECISFNFSEGTIDKYFVISGLQKLSKRNHRKRDRLRAQGSVLEESDQIFTAFFPFCTTITVKSDFFPINYLDYFECANLVQVLSGTLNPSTTHQCFQILSEMKFTNGFSVQLLIITDDANQNISIRQSALVYLKNLLSQHCQQREVIPQADLNTIKASLLEALIRNVQNHMLTPTFREIIFKLAGKYYPRAWSQVVDQSVKLLETSGSLDELLGAVQALKAIYSVFGGSISKQIQLNNLCNKSILPILSLASRLFQNFNQQTSTVLVGIFKLLSTSIQFYMPKIIELNIHSFMIFVKKILDLNADLSSDDNINLYLLKKISLRILFRLYQRHANLKITDNKQFAQLFHMKYTRPFVQTLVLQTLLRVDGDRKSRHRAMQLIKLSLSCLAYINRQNSEAATLLLQHRDGMIKLCMDKFRVSLAKTYQSFNDFKLYNQQSRLHLKEFILSLIECQSIPEQQTEAVSSILSLLLEFLQKGDNEQKDLALYIFTQISTPMKYLKQSLDQKMIALLLNYVQPLLKEDQHLLIRARACQMIASYHYLQFPENSIKDMAMLIYGCLLVGNSEKQIILKIYACNAFNSLMKYQNIVEFIRPYLQDILKIYTSLLETDTSIIKNFEDLINLLEEEISPYANDLAGMLIDMFANYTSDNPQNNQQTYQTLDKQQNGQEQEEDQFADDQQDNNNQYNARACISTIRQVLQVNNATISEVTQKKLLDIVVWVFSDTNQNYIEQGYNILNLLLYKMQTQVSPQYFLFFKVIVYAILGLPPNYIEDLNRRGDGFSLKFAQILSNICIEPDADIIQNSIGCLRNFIAKSNGDFLRNEKDELNISLMDYIMKLVVFVHQNASTKASQTDRLIILTLYITLIQYQVVNSFELNQIVNKVTMWMQMEHEKVEEERLKQNNTGFSTFGKNLSSVKYIYTPIYLQILLLAINFYTNDLQVNITNIVQRSVAFAEYFKCDYELSRIIFGFSHILNNKLVGDEQTLKDLLNSLPQLVRRLCQLRQEGDMPANDLEMDDEAEEQQFFGDDQNTHMLGWQGSKPTEKDMMLKKDSEEQQDHDWQEQFNKFYESPLDKLDELKFLQVALASNAQIYGSFITPLNQNNLSTYLANAPPKN